MNLVRVAAAQDLWDGELHSASVDGVPLLLARIDGKVCAFLDRCPHLGARLSEGTLHGTTLTCTAHCWQFDLASGCGINPASARLTPVPLVLRDDGIFASAVALAPPAERQVGPVLLRSAVSRALADAVCAANPQAQVEFRGAYVRVHAPAPCVVTREQIETRLGDAFQLPADLERAMPSWQGRLSISEGEVRWD